MKDFFVSIKIKKSYLLTVALFLVALFICITTVRLVPFGISPIIENVGAAEQAVGFQIADESLEELPTEAPTEPPEPDTEPPIFITGSTVNVKVGAENIPAPMICIDNLDKSVVQTVEGNYDLNRVGTYNLVRVAVDSSGNKTEFPFKLNVMSELPEPEEEKSAAKVDISDLISLYKTDSTSIGIDVSKWQGDIDWQKVKNSGVEFVILRLGVQDGFYGEPKVDDFFLQNYKGAKSAGLKVGAYFYSYATSKEESKTHAEFVAYTLKSNSCKLDLPIAYDWESWSRLGILGLNLIEFNDMAKVFLDTLNAEGYSVMLYSSKYYLEKNMWRLQPDKYPVWLAHYTNKDNTSYTGDYKLWQCSCTGVVPGINGCVDIDVLYK